MGKKFWEILEGRALTIPYYEGQYAAHHMCSRDRIQEEKSELHKPSSLNSQPLTRQNE
jgi:hypothetical protein